MASGKSLGAVFLVGARRKSIPTVEEQTPTRKRVRAVCRCALLSLAIATGCGDNKRNADWCGDGVVDPGEICDDHNVASGDGCSYDCASTESCANGIVDHVLNEQCDDGNKRNRDGCSSDCRDE